MTEYDVVFQSGSSEVRYTEDSNISLIEITNSDQEYYQHGSVQLYNVPSTQNIGDTCHVLIDDSLEFNGYIQNRQQTIDKGVKFWQYQLVGKTYDLWRYYTTADKTYTNKTTAFIASSLVGEFATGITAPDVDVTDGSTITGDIVFDYETVGDALIRLTQTDSYKFYVNNDDELVYYYPSSDNLEVVNVVESDIIDMTPIEESDEDLVNDCLIIGGTGYSAITEQDLHSKHNIIPNGVIVGQKFKAEDTRLAAAQLYLGRTLDPLEPSELLFEIWEGTEKTLFTDNFLNYTYLNSGTNSYNMQVSGSYLCLAHDGSNYKTSGQIESYCYSGLIKYDCQYIKPTLTSVTSSNRIYLSGTADSGGSWVSLTKDVWTDMTGYSGSAVKIRYKMSSNGDYTPKIDICSLTISNADGGAEERIFDDAFSNNTYISSVTNMIVDDRSYNDTDHHIYLSGNNASQMNGKRMAKLTPDSQVDTDDEWANEDNIIDESELTYGTSNGNAGGPPPYHSVWHEFTYNTAVNSVFFTLEVVWKTINLVQIGGSYMIYMYLELGLEPHQ